jgi:hypothetical protein
MVHSQCFVGSSWGCQTAGCFEQLKAAMSTFPVPAWHNTAVKVTPPVRLSEELPEDLMQIKKVLVCVDGHKPLLAPLTWADLGLKICYFKISFCLWTMGRKKCPNTGQSQPSCYLMHSQSAMQQDQPPRDQVQSTRKVWFTSEVISHETTNHAPNFVPFGLPERVCVR